MIRIAPASPRDREIWVTLLDLARWDAHWTLIGARMVELHAAEHRRAMPRASLEGDALADVRRRPGATRELARILVRHGFQMRDPSPHGQGLAFVRGAVEIDVLAPDGLRSPSARLTLPPAHTVEVPGGTQALHRSEVVGVQVGRRTGNLRRPSLLGAILLKTRAVGVDDTPADQRIDLALLLSLVREPETLSARLSAPERGWLRRRREMDDPNAPCWVGFDADAARRGLAALRILGGFRRPR